MNTHECMRILAEAKRFVQAWMQNTGARNAAETWEKMDLALRDYDAHNPSRNPTYTWDEATILDEDPEYNRIKQHILNVISNSRRLMPMTMKRLAAKLSKRRRELIGKNPAWHMHRSRSGKFAFRGRLIRATEARNPVLSMEESDMQTAENPELLIVGNPRRRRRRKNRNKRINYRGKRLYYIQLMRKIGKKKASAIWRRRFPKKCLTGGRRRRR